MERTNEEVKTYPIGAAGLIYHFLQRQQLGKLLDSKFPIHGNRQGLGWGKLAEVFILYLLERPRAMYRMEAWYGLRPYINMLYPEAEQKDFTDDRIGDLLDSINKYGINKLYNELSINVIKEFDVDLTNIHFDLTNFRLYGEYKDSSEANTSLHITFGHDKLGDKQKKLATLGVAVSGDGGIPIGMNSYAGNQADVGVYWPFWQELSNSLGKTNFLYIADCKLSSKSNMLNIAKKKGFFLAPLAMNSTVKKRISDWIEEKDIQTEILKVDKKTGEVLYEGFERNSELLGEDGHVLVLRQFVIHSTSLYRTRSKGLDRRIKKTEADLELLVPKLNRGKLINKEAIEKKIEKIFKARKTASFFKVKIVETKEIIKKQVGRGRPSPNTKYKNIEKSCFSFSYEINEEAVAKARKLGGYYILATNQLEGDLAIPQAFQAYKGEYKVEDTFRRFKGNVLQTVPMYLQKPERINAMLFLLTVAAQLLSLIDREAAHYLADKNDEMEGLFPNKITTPRPKAERMMDAFSNISLICIAITGQKLELVTSLNSVQQKILRILNVPVELYRQDFIVNLIRKSNLKIVET